MSYKRHLYLEIVFIYFLKSLHCNRYSLTKEKTLIKCNKNIYPSYIPVALMNKTVVLHMAVFKHLA